MANNIKETLDISRNELLDMGLRGNSLLHFSSKKSIDIIDEKPDQIFDLLVHQQKPMSFAAFPELDDNEATQLTAPTTQLEDLDTPDQALPDDDISSDDLSPDYIPSLLEAMYGEERHNDSRLQTRLKVEALGNKLLTIYTDAKSMFDEQGVTILYLSLGFLTWYEAPSSEKRRRAPLILLPVTLARGSAMEPFSLRYTQDELSHNLLLAAKLKTEFNLILPEFDDQHDILDYFESVASVIKEQEGWEVVADDIALGFFSFGRYQIYQDLDSDNWPTNSQPSNHSILQKLLGDGFGDDEPSDPIDLSETGENQVSPPDPTSLHFVKDADSSQAEAIMAVKRGQNLVIQGPPGTGKSQTITNIIAEAIADNRSVLFVSEKMAALDVVKRRLDESHLGDGVLELHSHKTNKRTVLEELKLTLEKGAPESPSRENDHKRHRELRTRLDTYSKAVSAPILNSGINYTQALGIFLQLKKASDDYNLPDLDFSDMREWSNEQFHTARNKARELAEHLKAMGTPSKSRFAASQLESFSPAEQNQLENLLKITRVRTLECMTLGKKFAHDMRLPLPEALNDIQTICRAAQRAIHAPHLDGLKLTTNDWQQRRDQISSLLDSGAEIHALQKRHQENLIEQAWVADLLTARQVYATTAKRWWRFLSSGYRRSRQQLQGLMRREVPTDAVECLTIIDDILRVQTLNEKYQQHLPLGEKLFGAQWQGLQSNWQDLKNLSNWIIQVYNDVGKGSLPDGLLRFLEGDASINDQDHELEKLRLASEELHTKLIKLAEELQLSNTGTFDSSPLAGLGTQLKDWLDNLDDLYHITRYNRLRKALQEDGLNRLTAESFRWERAPELLVTALELTWYSGLINTAYAANDAIGHFDRLAHENAISQFRKLDKALFSHAQESLARQLYKRIPHGSTSGEMAVILRETNKKRRHMPLRKLLSEAGRAIQQIKPVFMMSPMSVATYLPQQDIRFDLVVFDEASQVRVVDALGAILRGKQAVVVGDTKQMPPTDFFGKSLELDDEEAEESHTADIESILSMFLSKGAPESMLRWHYRSQHESLITVSNHEFYDNKLMVFPSSGINPKAQGLQFHYVESTYDRGKSRANQVEANEVANAVMQHARLHPDVSLGVVAFSSAQRDSILYALEKLRRDDESCEEFFNTDRAGDFFVKNLENVQGDERDVIFISIGYGKTSDGKLSRNFGPLNKDGGHRRLNVLITRARLAMEVFCNFTADELATDSSTPFGVRALKTFLHYAEKGDLPQHHETGKETDSPFEDEVISAIRDLGYEVEPQVGSAGYHIDIAVRDPETPGRYILAVECDGASYHSAASARDRDRLRQSVLEGLGWRFHRIWSTDWFRNAHKETDRLKEAIIDAISYYRELDSNIEAAKPEDTAEEPTPSITRATSSHETTLSPSYEMVTSLPMLATGRDVHEIPPHKISQALSEIAKVEGPIHIIEAARRIAEQAGVTRVGSRIRNHVEDAAKRGHNSGLLHQDGEFLYENGDKTATVRDRSALPSAMKKIELVAPEEIDAAVLKAVELGLPLSEEELIQQTLSLLGFQRATEKNRRQIQLHVEKLVIAEQLVMQAGKIALPAA